MNKEYVAGLIKNVINDGSVHIDEPMSRHTSFKVGGPADILVVPANAQELAKVIEVCRTASEKYFIMGNGSNLVVRDKGIRGVVIKIYNTFNKFIVEDDVIEAEAGMLLSTLSNIALKHGLSGLEFASGIPGTLGGAVTMNAGAYGGEMKDVVVKTEYMNYSGNIKLLEGEQHQFGYRTSIIQKQGGIVLKSRIKLNRGNKAEIEALMRELARKRTEKQPLEMPSAGSIFKRPEGHFVGKLVEDCGLKGYKIGGAEVSGKHCGFIVNSGGAAASDIIDLIEYIKKEVKLRFGVDLQTEVKIIGEE